MFYRNVNLRRYFDTLRLHVRLVRGHQREGGGPKCLTTAACDSLQVDLCRVLNRALHLDFEVLLLQWSRLVEIWGTQKLYEDKRTPTEHLRFACGQLQHYSSAQETAARYIKGHS